MHLVGFIYENIQGVLKSRVTENLEKLIAVGDPKEGRFWPHCGEFLADGPLLLWRTALNCGWLNRSFLWIGLFMDRCLKFFMKWRLSQHDTERFIRIFWKKQTNWISPLSSTSLLPSFPACICLLRSLWKISVGKANFIPDTPMLLFPCLLVTNFAC